MIDKLNLIYFFIKLKICQDYLQIIQLDELLRFIKNIQIYHFFINNKLILYTLCQLCTQCLKVQQFVQTIINLSIIILLMKIFIAKISIALCIFLLSSMISGSEIQAMDAAQFRPYMFTEEIDGLFQVFAPTTTKLSSQHATIEQYTILMERIKQQILPSKFPKTQVFAYGGITQSKSLKFSYPGPALLVKKNQQIQIKWVNKLFGNHIFDIETSFPFNSSSVFKNQIPVIPHAHGIATHVDSDGQPQGYWTALGNKGPKYATIQQCQNNEAVFKYNNEQDAGLYMYHDHVMGNTRLNVYAGLVGYYQILNPNSTQEKAISDYYGPLERKFLVISDKKFRQDGSMHYSNKARSQYFKFWEPQFFGNTIVVNGKLWPKMIMQQKKYRIVLLNGCQARYLNIFFMNKNNKIPFDLLRMEGDYYSNPVRVTEFLLSIAARVEIVVDLTKIQGEVIMKNNAQAPHPIGDPQNLVDEFTGTIMKMNIKNKNLIQEENKFDLIVRQEITELIQFVDQDKSNLVKPQFVIDNFLIKQKKYPAFPPGKPIYATLIELQGEDGQSAGMFIDGMSFKTSEKCLNATYKLGETYDFHLINLTPDSHPLHMHLINFQKIAQIPFDSSSYEEEWYKINGQPGRQGYATAPKMLDPQQFYTGPSIPIKQSQKTFRDIIDAFPHYVTVIRVKFSHNNGQPFGFETKGKKYVWHCHMLEHEDNEMMKYFCLE